jgi:predicted RNA-binding Zn-ribbon protein involved in translation (DUF1610 family)
MGSGNVSVAHRASTVTTSTMPSHLCPTCGEVLGSVAKFVAHKKAHRRSTPTRVVGTMKQCQRCGSVVPAQAWHEHRRACYDRQSERRPHSSSSQWKRLRDQILERDGHRCTAVIDGVRCQTTEALQVAHLAGDWHDDNPAGLAALCEPHHKALDAARS